MSNARRGLGSRPRGEAPSGAIVLHSMSPVPLSISAMLKPPVASVLSNQQAHAIQ